MKNKFIDLSVGDQVKLNKAAYTIEKSQGFFLKEKEGYDNIKAFRQLGLHHMTNEIVSVIVGYVCEEGDFPEVKTLYDLSKVINVLNALFEENANCIFNYDHKTAYRFYGKFVFEEYRSQDGSIRFRGINTDLPEISHRYFGGILINTLKIMGIEHRYPIDQEIVFPNYTNYSLFLKLFFEKVGIQEKTEVMNKKSKTISFTDLICEAASESLGGEFTTSIDIGSRSTIQIFKDGEPYLTISKELGSGTETEKKKELLAASFKELISHSFKIIDQERQTITENKKVINHG